MEKEKSILRQKYHLGIRLLEDIERKESTVTSLIQSLFLFDHFFCPKNESIVICLSDFEFGDLFNLPFLQAGEK